MRIKMRLVIRHKSDENLRSRIDWKMVTIQNLGREKTFAAEMKITTCITQRPIGVGM